MPGNILDVRVSAGQAVKKGDVLLILEAMKMENEILAARDGVVASVAVAKGATVNSGDVMLTPELTHPRRAGRPAAAPARPHMPFSKVHSATWRVKHVQESQAHARIRVPACDVRRAARMGLRGERRAGSGG